MALKIFIPTFQRPSVLVWSLDSVLKQSFENTKFEKKIFVINNDFQTKNKVDDAVNLSLSYNALHNFDEVNIIQGNSSLPGTINLWGIIRQNTNEEDVAIIHCDDDIMLPQTLYERYMSTLNSSKDLLIAKAIGTAYFFENKDYVCFNKFNLVFENKKNEYLNAISDDLVNFSIPFLSVYTFKTNSRFWNLYSEAIGWSDALPYEPSIKYPFVPFFIGLSAFKNKNLACSNTNIVIRGQVFKFTKFKLPIVVTEYANTGIILLTGLSVLMNSDLYKENDFDNIRLEFRKNVDDYLLQTLFKRQGVKFSQLDYLFKTTATPKNIFNFISIINLKRLRNLFDNLIFDTRYLKTNYKGWGPQSTIISFWTKLANK
jgi:hypothetical protein